MTTTLTVNHEGASFTIKVDRFVFDRWEYKITVTIDGEYLHDSEVKAGCNEYVTPLAEMLASWLNFLSAWAESITCAAGTGENADSFPRGGKLEEWATAMGSDAISMLADEIWVHDDAKP